MSKSEARSRELFENKMKLNIKILIGFLAVVILGTAFFLAFLQKDGAARAFVDRGSYQVGENLEVAVENGFNRDICFSSCYPYLMERQQENGSWEEYDYPECLEANRAIDCVAASGKKKFRVALDDVAAGIHRLKIAACVGCAANESFKSQQVLYSDIFQIK